MKIVVLIFLLFTFRILAQENGSISDYNLSTLKAPSAPAFSIIGLNPSDINSPSSIDELVADLKNSFIKSNNFNFYDNLSFELCPYWLVSHPTVTYADYVNNNFMN